MKKKGQGMMMVSIAIMAIIGVVILGVVFSFLNDNSLTTDSVAGESVTTSNNTATVANADTLDLTSFYNTTDTWTDQIGVDVNLTNGVLTTAANITDGAYSVNYTYYPTGYIDSSTNRTLMSLLPVMLAIVLLVGIIGYNVLK